MRRLMAGILFEYTKLPLVLFFSHLGTVLCYIKVNLVFLGINFLPQLKFVMWDAMKN
jgi:hypothetical protein